MSFTWDMDEFGDGIGSVDSDWSKYGKRRVKVSRCDDFEDVISWIDRNDLEGDFLEVDGVECEIDGFGSTFHDGGSTTCYMYLVVPDGETVDVSSDTETSEDTSSDDTQTTDTRRSRNSPPQPVRQTHTHGTTGPGGCPKCGGPTSINGEPCGGCI